MIPDFSGDFISAKVVKDGDIVEILNEGEMKFSEALKKECFNIQVKLNDKVKFWSPSNKQGKILQQSFGLDTKSWIGKKVILHLVEEHLLIKPIVEKKV